MNRHPCATCGLPVNRETSWLRVERGAVIHGQVIPADRDFCRPACLAVWCDRIEQANEIGATT